MPIELFKDDEDILKYLRVELAAAQAEYQAATTPETKRDAVEHFHQMLHEVVLMLGDEDKLVLLLCDEEEQQNPNAYVSSLLSGIFSAGTDGWQEGLLIRSRRRGGPSLPLHRASRSDCGALL